MLEPLLRDRPVPVEATIDRVFPLIAFDWDGTAVPDRHADAAALGAAMDRLLRAGARLAVLTGTRFAHVDGALAGHIRGPHVARLFVAANRGSELYGYDASGEPILLFRRRATAAEEEALDRAADAVAGEVSAATSLDVSIVRDRLNRRKLDLFPSWAEPPKSRIGEVVEAVEARLAGSGWRGGIAEVVRRARAHAAAVGLLDARVTSDGKHVEIGLTDKADAVDAVLAWTGEPGEAVLLVGDEVGPVGGVPGSDARMRTARATGAALVSVGPEPEGVPRGVTHLGGGPERFVALLNAQVARRAAVGADVSAGIAPAVNPTTDPTRTVVDEGLTLVREHEIEACFTVGNGAAGVRGALSEGTPLSAPATRIAGAWTRADGLPALARAPEWTGLVVEAGGVPVAVDEGAPDHRRALDLAQGMAWRTFRHVDPLGRVTELRVARFASVADRRLLAERVEIATINWSGELRVTHRVTVPPEWRAAAPGTWTGPGAVAIAAAFHGETPVGPAEPVPGSPEAADRTWRVLTRPGATWRLDRVCAFARAALPRAPTAPSCPDPRHGSSPPTGSLTGSARSN